MSPDRFITRLADIQAAKESDKALLLQPALNRLPLPIQRFDEPLLPFGKAVIDATNDLVCAYVFDLAAYLTMGAAGAIALERTIDYAGGDAITILHGPFATPGYAKLMEEESFGVDAVTLVDTQLMGAFSHRPDRSAFVVRKGEAQFDDAPGRSGIYWEEAERFTILGQDGRVLKMKLVGNDVLYAGRGDDFAAQIRAALEAYHA